MESSSPINYVMIANILAGCAVIFYLVLMWVQHLGWITISPRLLRPIRWICVFMLLMPIAARHQYSEATILYISSAMFIVGFLIYMKKKMGI